MNGEKGICLGDAWRSGSEPKQGEVDILTGGSPSVESQIQSRVRGASTWVQRGLGKGVRA